MSDHGIDKDKVIHSIELLNSQSSILINSKVLGNVIANLSASGLMLAKEINNDDYSNTHLLVAMSLVAVTIIDVTDALIDSIIESGDGINSLFDDDNSYDGDDWGNCGSK